MNLALLRALRAVIRADSDPARQALFASLMRSSVGVRLVCGLHARLGPTSAALLVSCYGLLACLRVAAPRARDARVIAIAGHENARRQVTETIAWIGAADCGWMRTTVTPTSVVTVLTVAAPTGRLRRAFRIVRRLDRRHGFLVACRAAGALAWYARARWILDARRPGAVLVSSDSNPEEVGMVAAARGLAIPQVFVSHAYPTPFSPSLDFTLSILEGEAAVEARKRKGPIRGAVLLAGLGGESTPLDPCRFVRPRPVIGIFTPKAISWATLAATVDDCRRHFDARQVIVRWHPSMLEAVRLADVLDDLSCVVESPRHAALVDVAKQCDWVVADQNSNVHLPVLKLGIPTVAVRRLGLYPESRADMYGFAADGIVFPPVDSIRDVPTEAFVAFFADWPARFRRYDASYLQPRACVAEEVHRAVWALLEPAAATVSRA
jgi:hypothetical protein